VTSTTATFDGKYALTINGDQLASHDDTVSLDVVNNGVQVTLNGETVQFDPGAITGIVVNTGDGTDTVNVYRTLPGVPVSINSNGGNDNDVVNVGIGGSVQGIQGALNIYNGPSWTHVVIDDSADSTDNPNVALSFGSLTGLSPAAIYFAGTSVNTLTIYGGSGNNTYNIGNPQGYLGDTLYTGDGDDTVNVKATAYPLTINGGGSGNDVVNLGYNNSLALVNGAVTINNAASFFHVNVNNLGDRANHPNVALSAGSLTGLFAPIYFGPASVSTLALNGGSGNNTYNFDTPQGFLGDTLDAGYGNDTVNVKGTDYPLTIMGENGSNSLVNVGNNGSLAGIAGDVNVGNGCGRATLVVDDSADTVGRTATITSSSITGLSAGGGAINYTAAGSATSYGVSAVTIDGGKGANTFNVLSTAAFAPLAIKGGIGSNDLVQIGNNGSLAGIAGDVSVANASGHTTLVVDDSNDLASHNNVVLTNHSVTGLSQGAINYSGAINELDVYGSQGGNAFEVQSLSSITNVNLHKGTAQDTVALDGVFPTLNVIEP
jgi:hypothetical protein